MIVTGIFDLEPYEKRGRSTRSYIEGASWLLGSAAPLVVFVDNDYRPLIREMRPKGATTLWAFPGPEPEALFSEEAFARSKFSWNPGKDTPRYLSLMRRKISWLRRGAEIVGGPVTWVDMALPGAPSLPPTYLLAGVPEKSDSPNCLTCRLQFVPIEGSTTPITIGPLPAASSEGASTTSFGSTPRSRKSGAGASITDA